MADPLKPRAAFAPWDRRELPGLFAVEESARRVGAYKWIEMRLFEALGGWVATVPELDVKLVLGRHCYHHAWHAELWDKRLPELRCGRKSLTQSEAGNAGFAAFVQDVAAPERPDQTIEKLVGIFDVLKPHLLELYETHMRETDQISDAPTIEILDEIARKTRRHIEWGHAVLDRLCDTNESRARRRDRAEALRRALIACGGATGELAPGSA